MTFGNLNNVIPGTYNINVKGQNGTETITAPLELRVLRDFFTNNEILPIYPSKGQGALPTSGIVLSWEKNNNAETYQVEVSNSPLFGTILFSKTTSNTSFSIEGLEAETVYYWRIKPENSCVIGGFSSIHSFQTGMSNCFTYAATDFSMAKIDTIANTTVSFVPFDVTNHLNVDKILVTADISHTYVADMTIKIEGPSSIGSTNVVLLSNKCGEEDDINTTFDDVANPVNCISSSPTISGTIAPLNNMSIPYAGKDAFGQWKLLVNDPYDKDGGQINSASISVCVLETNTIIPSLTHSEIIVDKNSTHKLTALDILASTESEPLISQVFTLISLPSKGYLEKNGITLSLGDTFNQKEVTRGAISYVNTELSAFRDEFKVDLTNQAKGWLPNQTIKIREVSALGSVDTF